MRRHFGAKKSIGRREFLKQAGGTALGATALTLTHSAFAAPLETEASFRSAWQPGIQRPWPGPEYWTNPLQDWRILDGRLECFSPGGDRNVVLLTRSVSARRGDLVLSVSMGQIEKAELKQGFAGFRIGIQHPANDYRASAIYGRGMNAGINADGRLFIGTLEASAPRTDLTSRLRLEMRAKPSAGGYLISLRAASFDGKHSAEIRREVLAEWLTGELALVCSSGQVEPTPVKFPPVRDGAFYPPHQEAGGTMRFWFKDWTVAGSKVDEHQDRAYGPVLFTLYTVSRSTLKLSAQFPPLGDTPGLATLEVRSSDGAWKPAATAKLDPDAWNATFRVADWDTGREREYRVLYSLPDGSGTPRQHSYVGTIRKDPDGKQNIKIGLLTCLWDFGFPHDDLTSHIASHKPDILFWTGDQVYEPAGGFGVIESRAPGLIVPAMLDFLRKWFVFGWAVRELTRVIPSVCMTDDHDMYHGNIWGCGGRPTNPAKKIPTAMQVWGETLEGVENDTGGYRMAPRWVNMVQRLQTSHLPDPFDPAPVLQNINVYYTDLRWGGISFAILEDRKWKSAPTQMLPKGNVVNGFPRNPAWNSAIDSNVPDAELLGERQLDFLESWAADWSAGIWMKFAVSQTPFGCLHTEPKGSISDDDELELTVPRVGVYVEGDHMVADHDSGGWPQRGRDAAIAKLRKGFAAHLSGDQHLGTTSHYGVEQFRDGVYGVCTPAMSSIWPRRWWPHFPAPHALPGRRNTGNYLDAFGNRMTVLAVANPAQYPGPGLEDLRFRATGYVILQCNRATRKTSITQWPRWVNPANQGSQPYDGWPILIDQVDNGLWGAEWELDPVQTPGFRDPVVQVQSEQGDVYYTLRIRGESFTPLVRKAGTYTVIAYDPDGDFRKEWKGVQARKRAT